MMSKKFIPVVLVLTAASLFLAFQTQGNSDKDNPKSKYTRIIRNVGLLLEQGHYSPKPIDDDFSKMVLKKFVEDLDGDKNIFLQGDIDAFKKFDTKIDDEIHGADLVSFFTISEVYIKRLKETAGLYTDILARPFDFSKDEAVMLDREKLNNPKTEAERKDIWKKRLKYMTLSKYSDMLDDWDVLANIEEEKLVPAEAKYEVVAAANKETPKRDNKLLFATIGVIGMVTLIGFGQRKINPGHKK